MTEDLFDDLFDNDRNGDDQEAPFDFQKRITAKQLRRFAGILLGLSNQVGFKMSSRGWCYLIEQQGWATKAQFDK